MDEDISDGTDAIVRRNLDFKPQRENAYNKLLPYAEYLDEESTKLFADIKTNLVKSVLAREMRPGCALWTIRLNKYMKIYGMKFSKEDHIALIKLFYELVTLPDLEPTRVNKCANTLVQLLKKKYLLTRDDLQLEWKPLYDLCVRVLEKSKTEIGMYRYFSTFEGTLFNVIRACRVYFPASATQEILDEFRPGLCPFNSGEIANTIQYLELFLPNAMKKEDANISYKLWFDEFMSLWDVCHNAGAWENNMMWIIAGLARFQIGHIDWEPYMSNMFVRFQRTLQLPVNFKQRQLGKQHKIDISAMCLWIVCALNGNNNSAFFHLEKMMQTVESYFHSANVGRWTIKLRELLRTLSYYFVQRVHSERYKTPTWDFVVPEEYKLKDTDIDRFVNILKPCIEKAMFSRMSSQDTTLCLQYLASLRPNIIVPMTLEKLYASMDSLTEPHKLTSSMMAVIAVGRYMVQGFRNKYPEGPTHIIPLLMSLLPGIDPNDIRKSYVTFNFIVHFVNMIPLVNSSDASHYHKLSEEEIIVCEATAGFEDFVLQFLDRLLIWVESSSLDFVRLEQMTNNNNSKNTAENIAESALASVISVVLFQCSPNIFRSALKKFYNFVINKIMEVQVSGKMIAIACHCFAKVNPHETLKLFIPYLCDTIEQLLNENPNADKEEHSDDELLYNLLLLSEVVDGRSELIQYMDRLTNILDRTLHVSCLKACQIAARMLELILASLTSIQPTEVRSSPTDYATPVSKFLPIREWGKSQNIKDLKISWYIPQDKEVSEVQKLVNKYLIPELDKLDKHSNGELKLSRQELKQTLKIVISILSCQPLLPIWEEPAYELGDSVLEPWAFNLKVCNNGVVTMPDGKNVRKVIVDTLHKLQQKILKDDEGDTKSIQNIIHIYNVILFNKTRGQDFEFHWKTFHMAKKILEDRLHQKKLHLRHLLIDRVMLQQEFRIESRNCSFTKTHKQILENLFELSVSRYSEVRVTAQCKMFGMISYFPYSYTILTPKIIEILQINSVQHHEKFKGCLYILLGPKNSPIVARHDWEFIRKLWPLIVKSMPSEKPSIINLISAVTDAVHKFFPTIAIKLIIPQSTITAAYNLSKTHPSVDLRSFQKYIDGGEAFLQQKSQQRRDAYEGTLNALLDACETGNLHWRYNAMNISFIKDLVHFDVKYNSDIVRFFLHSSISELINIRKNAMKVLAFITIQNKPKFEKVEIDPFKFSNSKVDKVIPGVREDNKWLLYNSKTLPNTVDKWEELRYLHSQVLGYYAWPKKLEVYQPPSKQPATSREPNNLSDTEKELLKFFTNEANVNQLIKYCSLEEKKGQDQFNCYRFITFKNLFKMFEDKLLPYFLPHLKRLVEDKQESSQRCAAEIICGVIRGSKHWPFEKAKNLWENILPIIDSAIINMCAETHTDWTLCITLGLDSRDPNRFYWLLEFLLDDPLKDPTSFVACNRLHLLLTAVSQQSWRNAEIYNRLLEYFKPHLSHPFQNIREKISSFLTVIFSKDLVFPNGNSTQGPKVEELFKDILPKLNVLYKYSLSKITDTEKCEVDKACDNLILMTLGSEEKKDEALRLFKTIGKFITTSMVRANFSCRPEFLKLLPLATVLQNYDTDEEIAKIATNLLVCFAQTMTIKGYIPHALDAIKEVAKCPLWSARAAICEYMPIFVYYNMATINAKKEWVLEIQNLVLVLLEDVQPEVRMAAAKVLNSLLHCQFIPQPSELLVLFKQKAKTKVKAKAIKSKDENSFSNSNMRVRHAGVLGLCSFISAHPYDVPDNMPEVFGELGYHLSDPQPIPATIRKTMGDFKRTHHDNWETHKLKFTEEELAVLSDLTVPPSYYV